MSIDRLESIGVADDEVVAVPSTLVGTDTHLAREGCAYGITHAELEVYPIMHTSEATAISVVRGDLSGLDRHHELLEVDVLPIRDIHCHPGKGIDVTTPRVVTIDVHRWSLQVFLLLLSL